MKTKICILVLILLALLSAQDIVSKQYELPYKGEEELDATIDFGLGELKIAKGAGRDRLVEALLEYDADIVSPVIDYKVLGNRGRLKMYTEDIDDIFVTSWKKRKRHDESDFRRNSWDLAFSREVPISFDIDLGLGKGELDFTDLRVKDLRLECGMSDVTMEFRDINREVLQNLSIESGLGNVEIYGLGNARMERLDVECGLGSTVLSFDGDLQNLVKGQISVGLGSVELQIPENVGVEIEAESSFLSSINLPDFDEIDDDVYRSENWRKSDYRIYLIVEIGLGSVDIDWID